MDCGPLGTIIDWPVDTRSLSIWCQEDTEKRRWLCVVDLQGHIGNTPIHDLAIAHTPDTGEASKENKYQSSMTGFPLLETEGHTKTGACPKAVVSCQSMAKPCTRVEPKATTAPF